LAEQQAGLASYDGERCSKLSREMSDAVCARLKDLGYDRFKYVVQVVIGERREQGVRMGTRCFFDFNTDNQATESYTNDSLYCVVTAYSVYLY
jgi:hypothetical protein